jgi:hypothetical protein
MDITATFLNINKIIERESKSSTYKFALLRGVIDIVQDNSPYICVVDGLVEMPLGLLMEKWILYYYPLLGPTMNIRQIGGGTQLAFEPQMAPVIAFYEGKGGITTLYYDMKVKGIPAEIELEFRQLLTKLAATIVNMPMRYIGNSFGAGEYSIFQKSNGLKQKLLCPIDLAAMVHNFGTFTIPLAYYEAFRILGSFINGRDSILMQWAELSSSFSKQLFDTATVIRKLLEVPVDERNVLDSNTLFQSLLREHGSLHCVWTGKSIRKIDIDHVIPFAVWHNNDLWNLLPASPEANARKRDKIPSVDQIIQSEHLILQYWDLLSEKYTHRFHKEVRTTLLGRENSAGEWQTPAMAKLKENCTYLIHQRGYAPWNS